MLLFSSASKILLFKSVGRKHTKKSYMNLKEDEISVSRRMPKKRMLLVQFRATDFVPNLLLSSNREIIIIPEAEIP
jgi:hypothetical protein